MFELNQNMLNYLPPASSRTGNLLASDAYQIFFEATRVFNTMKSCFGQFENLLLVQLKCASGFFFCKELKYGLNAKCYSYNYYFHPS